MGYIRSVYSASQIVGGVVLAIISDRGVLSRRGVLIVSFAGAALSYTIVGLANSVSLLLFSRVGKTRGWAQCECSAVRVQCECGAVRVQRNLWSSWC